MYHYFSDNTLNTHVLMVVLCWTMLWFLHEIGGFIYGNQSWTGRPPLRHYSTMYQYHAQNKFIYILSQPVTNWQI